MLSSLKYLPEDPFDLAALEDSLSKPFTFQKVRLSLIYKMSNTLLVIRNVLPFSHGFYLFLLRRKMKLSAAENPMSIYYGDIETKVGAEGGLI
jgi:hypothetical protein